MSQTRLYTKTDFNSLSPCFVVARGNKQVCSPRMDLQAVGPSIQFEHYSVLKMDRVPQMELERVHHIHATIVRVSVPPRRTNCSMSANPTHWLNIHTNKLSLKDQQYYQTRKI